jgi:hypothetical protein
MRTWNWLISYMHEMSHPYLIGFTRRCPPIAPDLPYERYLKAVLTRSLASYPQYRRIAGY